MPPNDGANPDLPVEHASVLVVTRSEVEWRAVADVFGIRRSDAPIPPSVERLASVTVTSDGRTRYVVLVKTPDGVNDPAAVPNAWKTASQRFRNIRHVIRTGVGYAIPKPGHARCHVRLGDIIVPSANGLLNLHGAKDAGENPCFAASTQPQPHICPWLTVAHSTLKNESVDNLSPPDWHTYAVKGARPGDWSRPTDVLFTPRGDENPCNVEALYMDDREKWPRVLEGTIIPPQDFLPFGKPEDLSTAFTIFNICATYMSAGEVVNGDHDRRAEYYVVLGMGNYWNSVMPERVRKQLISWQRYAALGAAAYTRALIENLPPGSPLPIDGDGVPGVPYTDLESITKPLTDTSPQAICRQLQTYMEDSLRHILIDTLRAYSKVVQRSEVERYVLFKMVKEPGITVFKLRDLFPLWFSLPDEEEQLMKRIIELITRRGDL